MTLKIAGPEDLSTVTLLVDEFMKDYKYKDMFPNMSEIIPLYLDPNNYSERMCVLIYASTEVIGLGAFEFVPALSIARISAVYLKPEYRKKGWTYDLVFAFETWGKRIGAKYYNLGISTGADMSKHGYEKYEVMYMKEVK